MICYKNLMYHDRKGRRSSMKQYDTDIFESDLEELGVSLSEGQLAQFLRYYEMLVEWNGRMNLTAITEYGDVLKKHFVDSLSLVKACDINSVGSLIDVGTGAGFPGLALKIAFPRLQVTLLDSLGKRIHFLEAVIGELKLTGVTAVHGRAEDFARPGKLRESFDLCVSRAVANLSTLSEYCIPFVKKDGLFLAYKSEQAVVEIEGAKKALAALGGKMEERIEFFLPGSDIYRSLFVIKKAERTPEKYPRKAGLPSKEPL